MKKVTKILMVVALAAFSFQSMAQTFGIKAGLNMANMTLKFDGEDLDQDKKMLMGFHVGATAEFDISEVFAFETGLILNQKGVKFDTDPEIKMTAMALDIPLNAKYKLDLGGNTLFFAAGPYVGFNISGKGKFGEEEEDLNIGSDEEEDDITRLDFGVNVGAGMEFGAFGIGVQYGLGLANLQPGGDSDNKISNKVLSIGLSYKFGK